MGGDLAKCVGGCTPNPNTTPSHSKSGEMDRLSERSDYSDYSDSSSSEGDADSDSSSNASSSSSSGDEEEEESSSSSSHHKRKKHRKSHSKKTKKKKTKTKKKNKKKNKKHKHKKYEQESSSSSSSSSSSYDESSEEDNDENKSRQSHHRMPDNVNPSNPMTPSYSMKHRNPRRKNIRDIKRKKDEDRVRRKLAMIESQNERKQQRLLEQQRMTHSLFADNDRNGFPNPLQMEPRAHSLHSHPNFTYNHNYNNRNNDNSSNNSSNDGSIHSLNIINKPSGKHPRIPSMTDFDAATIHILSNQNAVQSLFDPNYQIQMVDAKLANSMCNGTNSTPNSPATANNNYFIQNRQAMTPNSHQWYNNNGGNNNGYRHSVDLGFPNINNLQLMARRNSNPNPSSFGNHHNMNMNMNMSMNMIPSQRQINIIDDNDVNEEYDDLPAMPRNNNNNNNNINKINAVSLEKSRSNSLPLNSLQNEHVFDISRAGLASIFQDNPSNKSNKTDKTTEIIDNTPSSTIKPNEKENEIPFGTMYNEMHQTNPADTDMKEQHNHNYSTTNISPKQSKSDQLDNSNRNEITIKKKLEGLGAVNANLKQINGQDPLAIPPSPPIISSYKPNILPDTMLNSRLSDITESSQGTQSHSTPRKYKPNQSDIPENEIIVTTSNETNESNQFVSPFGMIPSPVVTDNLNALTNDNSNVALSSPDDDEETVARQWMDLHRFNIPDDDGLDDVDKQIKNTNDDDLPLSSIKYTISSDHEQNDRDVQKWKNRNSNSRKSANLAPQSSEEEEDQKDMIHVNNINHTIDSQYSSETNQSSTDESQNTFHDKIRNINHNKPRNMFSQQSIDKWKSVDIEKTMDDMQKQYDYMKELEHNEMQSQLTDLKLKHKQSNRGKQWIETDHI